MGIILVVQSEIILFLKQLIFRINKPVFITFSAYRFKEQISSRLIDSLIFYVVWKILRINRFLVRRKQKYEGYIVNNRKYYGFAGSYKAFIKIGNNVRVEYPKYKEKKLGLWSAVCNVARGVWQFCSYVFVPQWGRNRQR